MRQIEKRSVKRLGVVLLMELRNSKVRLIEILFSSLLFLMIIFQSQLYAVKICLIALICLLIPLKIKITSSLLFFVIPYLLFGLWGIFIGILNQTDYPFSNITVTIFWPLLFLLIVAQVKTEKHYSTILKAIFYGHLFVVIYDLFFAYSIILGYTFPKIYPDVETAFSFYGTTSRLNFVNLNALTYTTPILYFLFIVKYNYGINRLLQFVLIILTFFLLVLSGRRSVMIQFLLLPIGLFFIKNLLPQDIRAHVNKTIFSFILFIGVLLLIIWGTTPDILEGYWNTFIKAFDSDDEPVKFVQQKMFIDNFFSDPIWGKGFGHMFYEPFPGRMTYGYQYELQYHLSLAQTGIIGFSFLLIAYLGTLFYGLYLSWKYGDILFYAFLFGYFFMLISNATNPVLCSFDLMIPLILCWAKINSNSQKTIVVGK